LKARICEVSPYLLLKRTDIKPTKANTNTWDFTDFPTIDATELIVTNGKLSQRYSIGISNEGNYKANTAVLARE
jgi:hypothetical protein